MSTWLITGSNSGLGRALAIAVLEHGHNAVLTARDVTKVQDIVDRYPDAAIALPLDVTDSSRPLAVVAAAESRFGAIDVLVNNAGYGYRAAVEEGDDADVRELFETHFFGSVATIKAVLPAMRARHAGAIVNISSIGARMTPEGSGYYSAAKAAVEGMSGSLQKELKPLGISVIVVEPGAFRTDFSGRSLTQSANPIADYASTAGKRRIENDTMHGTQPGDPAKAAEAIILAVESPEPPEMLLLGTDAVAVFGSVLNAQLASLEKWRELSESTNYPPQS